MKKKLIAVLTFLCLVCSLCAFAACGGKPSEPKNFELVSREITVSESETADIVVNSKYKEEIEYTSYNTAVASVSESGKVTGVAEGNTFVAVKLDEKQEICKVTVKKNEDAIFLGSEKINLAVGSEQQWTAVVYRNGEAQEETVSWQITDSDACEFAFNGNSATFKATQTGEFTLTATSANLSATCLIRVVSQNAKRLATPVVMTGCGGSVTWNAVTGASGYAVYVNGESYLETEEAQADLSKITSALKNGERLSVAVEALAGENYDYIDSSLSMYSVAHDYAEEKQGDISCKTYGNIKYTCSDCGHTYTDENVLTEHTWEGDSCSVCGIKGVAISITNELLGWKMQPGTTEYAVLLNGERVGKTAALNFDLSGYFDLSQEGEYTVDVQPVGSQSMFITTNVRVVRLTSDNFVSKLSESYDGYTFYVLTENVSLSHTYSEQTLNDADGLLPADQLCSSPVDGLKNAVLEGNGHKVTVSFDGTPKTNNSWEVMGGLFGYTDNALIRNLRTDIEILQSGHLHRIFSSGALVAVMKGNTQIKDCYLKSRIRLNSDADYNANGGYGAVAGLVRAGNDLSVIERCVVDSMMYNGSTAIGAPKAIVGVMDTDVLVTNNAYIVNEAIPNRDSQMQAKYQGAFLSWTLPSQNWLFESLSDFMFGERGDYCDYNATGAWEFNWTYGSTPKNICGVARLYESQAWSGTSFAYDDANGITLCREALLTSSMQTPQITHGVLTWEGSAKEYGIYNGDTLLDHVTDKSYDLVARLGSSAGEYQIAVKAVGYNELLTYEAVPFAVVNLTNANFIEKLSAPSGYTYYVLTENVAVNTDYQADKRTTANGSFEEALVYAPVAELHGILDGRGYQISVTYGGGAKIDDGWEVFGGLFGYTENAIIQNVNFDFVAQLNGHVHKSFASGALAAVLGRNTVIQNCYVQSVINVWNATDVNGIGAIAGKLFGGASGCVIKNNVVSARIVLNSVQQDSPDRLVADLMENTQMNGNAYIINRALPTTIDADHKLHEEAFMAWGVNAVDNWLFASMNDFLSGGVGHKCTYFGATDWHFDWALSQTPSEKLYESEAWAKTTFAYDDTNGLTLCGKAVVPPITYTVTWKNDDGSVLETDTDIAKNARPEYNGTTPVKANTAEYTYTFAGWSDGANTYATVAEVPAVTRDVTYTAVFTSVKNKYTVTFLGEGGTTEIQKAELEYGTSITAPADPTKANTAEYTYTFAGWNDGTHTYTAAELPAVTGDATYTAVFTSVKNKYTVTFLDANGTTKIQETEIEYGVAITAPADPTKDSDSEYIYTFDGWYTTKEGGDKVTDFGTVTGNATYYARFTRAVRPPDEYIIKFNMNGHGVQIADATTSNKTITAPAEPTANGYTFGGWFASSDCTGTAFDFATAFTQNTTLYAKWTVIEYTITFKKGETTVAEVKYTVENLNSFAAPSVPPKTGYNGAWEAYALTDLGDKTVNAVYTAIEYTITYAGVEGITGNNSNPATYTIESATITLQDVAKDGYVFDGWYLSDEKVTEIANGSMGDVTLTAKWKEIVTPSISDGVMSFEKGDATAYKVLIGDIEIGATNEKSFRIDYMIADAIKGGTLTASADNAYGVQIHPVGESNFVYNAVSVKVVALMQSNFVVALNTSCADAYYVLTENVTYSFSYTGSGVLYTPVEEFKNATLDGRGYKISVNYIGAGYATEMLGGLFGTTESVTIKNVNFELTASLGGNRVLPNAYSAAFIHTAKDGTGVNNCYIRSRITATSDIPEEDNKNDATKLTSHFGPIVASIPQNCVVAIRNCVIDSAIYRNDVLLKNTMTLGGSSIVTPLFMQNNAYIVNDTVEESDFADGGTYKSSFYTDSIQAENWLFVSLNDFTNGNNGNYCKSENWNCTWETNASPADKHGNVKLYESEAWANTTFAYVDTNELTLCGKAVVQASE